MKVESPEGSSSFLRNWKHPDFLEKKDRRRKKSPMLAGRICFIVDIARKQRLITGQDYLENEKHVARAIPFFYNLMIEKKSPEEMEKDPELKDFMHNQWRYDGEGRFHGRHYTFWQQLQDTRLFTAWANTPAHVLSIWGEGEFVALNPYEHKLIADIVNHYNPGKAKFYSMPNIDHGFVKVNDVQHAVEIRNDCYTSLNSLSWVFADKERLIYGVPMFMSLVGGVISIVVLVTQ